MLSVSQQPRCTVWRYLRGPGLRNTAIASEVVGTVRCALLCCGCALKDYVLSVCLSAVLSNDYPHAKWPGQSAASFVCVSCLTGWSCVWEGRKSVGDPQGRGNVFVNDLWLPVTAVCVCPWQCVSVCSCVAEASGGSSLSDLLHVPPAIRLFSSVTRYWSLSPSLKQQSRRWRKRRIVSPVFIYLLWPYIILSFHTLCPPLLPTIISSLCTCFSPSSKHSLSLYLYQPLPLEQRYGIGTMLVVYH